jgi:hypothetical protein
MKMFIILDMKKNKIDNFNPIQGILAFDKTTYSSRIRYKSNLQVFVSEDKWNPFSCLSYDSGALNVHTCITIVSGLRQCRHLRFLISFGDKIRPMAIFLATTFYLSKITSYCCQSTAQVRNTVCHFSRKSGVTFAHTSQVYRLEVWTSK